MADINLKIITPESEIFNESIDQLDVSTSQGQIGILPNHTNLMSTVIPGELKIMQGSKIKVMAVGDGLLMINDNQIKLLVDMAEEATSIDEKKVEEAKKRAELALEQTQTDEEYATTLATIDKLTAQLKVKRRHHER